MKAKNLLEFDSVTMAFGGNSRNPDDVVALEDFDLVIEADKPQIIAIAGESGSGKTTLARLGLGMVKPTGGSVIYKGQDLWTMSNQERRDYRREVQAIFQDPLRRLQSLLYRRSPIVDAYAHLQAGTRPRADTNVNGRCA